MRSIITSLLLLTAACASARQAREDVRPSGRAERDGADVSSVAAEYRLPAGGEASIWSKGIYRKELLGRESTVVHVGLAFDNEGDEAVVVDARQLRLASVDVGDETLTSIHAVKIDGDVIVIQPGEEREVSFYFMLPEGVAPQDVDAFAVRWGARVGGESFVRTTPFKETTRLRYDPLAHHGSTARIPGTPVVY